MVNPFEQPKIPEIEIEKSEAQVYVEKNLKEFENVEVKFAFELQFEYLKSIGKSQKECVAVIENYLDKSFNENEVKERENGHRELMDLLDNTN